MCEVAGQFYVTGLAAWTLGKLQLVYSNFHDDFEFILDCGIENVPSVFVNVQNYVRVLSILVDN